MFRRRRLLFQPSDRTEDSGQIMFRFFFSLMHLEQTLSCAVHIWSMATFLSFPWFFQVLLCRASQLPQMQLFTVLNLCSRN